MEDLELLCVMIIALVAGELLFEKLNLYLEDLRKIWEEEKGL